jgi:hypothetical protein
MQKKYITIPMDQLKPSQGVLSDLRVKKIFTWMNASSDFSIMAFYKDGYYHIFDGHHRAYCWNQLNQQTITIELMRTSDQILDYVSYYRKPLVEKLEDLQIIPDQEYKTMSETKNYKYSPKKI